MRRPQGYATLTDRVTGRVKEWDTFQCKHCQHIVHVKPMAKPEDLGGHCKVCDRLVCSRCARRGRCVTWERQMEIIEARDRLCRAASGG